MERMGCILTKVFSAKSIHSGSHLIQDTIKQTFHTSLYTKYITDIYLLYTRYIMKIIVDLDQAVLDKVQKEADNERRSRKQMLELIIEDAVK